MSSDVDKLIKERICISCALWDADQRGVAATEMMEDSHVRMVL